MLRRFQNNMQQVIKKNHRIGKYSLFASRDYSSLSSSPKYKVQMIPDLVERGSVIIPISSSRYLGDKEKALQYDRDIARLLQTTANCLQQGFLERVDVVSAAGLQELDIGKKRAQEIEDHFFNAHKDLLKEQTTFYSWNDFIDQAVGRHEYEKNLSLVQSFSTIGSEWYLLMEKAFKNIKLASTLEGSMEYQRREYAAILSMRNKYSQLIYMGSISLPWAFLYKKFPDLNLPVFTRAVIEKVLAHKDMSANEAYFVIKMLVQNIESVMTNSSIPPKEKQKLVDMATSLFYAYSPKIRDSEKTQLAVTEDTSLSSSSSLISDPR